MGHVVAIANFKGGVGKTTTCTLFAYLLEKMKQRTLLIDFDPQGSASDILSKTYLAAIQDPHVSFLQSIEKNNLALAITSYTPYLDLIPSNWNLAALPDLIADLPLSEQNQFLNKLLTPVARNYDFVLIDTPPNLSEFTDNAIIASDSVVMLMQTQEQSFSSSIKFIQHLHDLREQHDAHFDLMGILPFQLKKNGKIDSLIMQDAQRFFGKAMFHNTVHTSERIRSFSRFGIHDHDLWDKRSLYAYQLVLDELLTRLKKSEVLS